MTNLLTKYEAWNSRREQRSLQRWERIRTEGKLHFVFTTSLSYGLTMVGGMDVLNRIFSIGDPISLSNIITYVLVGIGAGLVGWSGMESKYRKALHQARRSRLVSGELPPRDYPLRITSD